MSWCAALLQEESISTGEIGGPKGAYQGAEPTRFGKCPVHGLVTTGVHVCSVLVELTPFHFFPFQGIGREEADARTFSVSRRMAAGNLTGAAVR